MPKLKWTSFEDRILMFFSVQRAVSFLPHRTMFAIAWRRKVLNVEDKSRLHNKANALQRSGIA